MSKTTNLTPTQERIFEIKATQLATRLHNVTQKLKLFIPQTAAFIIAHIYGKVFMDLTPFTQTWLQTANIVYGLILLLLGIKSVIIVTQFTALKKKYGKK